MKKFLIAVGLLVTSPALAEVDLDVAREFGAKQVEWLAANYACKTALGPNHYNMARRQAVNDGMAMGLSHSRAVRVVAELEPHLVDVGQLDNDTFCLQLIEDLNWQLKVLRARLELD